MNKKIVIIAAIFAIFLIMPVAHAETFTQEYRDSHLTFGSKIAMWFDNIKSLTVPGTLRGCGFGTTADGVAGVYPTQWTGYADRSGYIETYQLPFNAVCTSGREGLVNYYAIQSDGGWKYMGEYSCPSMFNPAIASSPVGKWAYEVYDCPPQTPVCTYGEIKCYSEKTYKECIATTSGITSVTQWSVEKSCPIYAPKCGIDSNGNQKCLASVPPCVENTQKCASASGTGYQICKSGTWVDYSCDAGKVCKTSASGSGISCETGTSNATKIETVTYGASVDGKQVVGSITLKNTGTSMTTDNVVEMQVVSNDASFFAVVPINQLVCDPAFPNNVHQTFKLDKDQQIVIPLVTQALAGGTYKAGFFVGTSCTAHDGKLVGTSSNLVIGEGCSKTADCPSGYICDNLKCTKNPFPIPDWAILLMIIFGIVIIGIAVYTWRKK